MCVDPKSVTNIVFPAEPATLRLRVRRVPPARDPLPTARILDHEWLGIETLSSRPSGAGVALDVSSEPPSSGEVLPDSDAPVSSINDWDTLVDDPPPETQRSPVSAVGRENRRLAMAAGLACYIAGIATALSVVCPL